MKSIHVLLLLLGLGLPCVSFGQAAGGSGGNEEVSLHGGRMLPNQISNVPNVVSFFGGRYSMNLQENVYGEFGYANANSGGVSWHDLSGSIRGDVPFDEISLAGIYAGIDINYYTQVDASDFRTELWYHLGVLGEVKIAGDLWARADLKFGSNEGTYLYMAIGFAYRGAF